MEQNNTFRKNILNICKKKVRKPLDLIKKCGILFVTREKP